MKWAVFLGLGAAYLLVFPIIYRLFGPPASALIAVPVAVAGWYLGLPGGLAASLISILTNVLLLVFFANVSWESALRIESLPGNIILLLTGVIAGRLREVLDERTRIATELRLRERYLALIGISTQDILAPVNPENRYYNLISHLVNLLVADYGHLIVWDKKQEKGILAATTREKIAEIVLDSRETNILSSILQSGQALAIDHAPNSNLVINPALSEETVPPPESVICIPLTTKEYKLGAVILAFNASHNFSKEEIYYAELAGKQVALALRNLLQDIEIQQRLHESRALSNISRALSETERVGLDEVLKLIVDSAKELIPATEHAVIHLLDEERQTLVPKAVSGYDKPSEGQIHMHLGEGVAGQVIAEGRVVNIPDVEGNPRYLPRELPLRFHSLMVAPVQTGSQRLGTISVQSNRPNAFGAEQEALLGSLGTQAAIAIENAHLFETTQQGLKEVNALYRITQRLAASLETEQLMKEVVDLLQQDFGYYYAQVYLIDQETDEIVLIQGSGEIGDNFKKLGLRLPAGAGIIGHTAETGEPFVTNNVEDIVFYISHPLLPDTRSELAVPIKLNDQVLGVLDIQHCPPGRLTEGDLQLMSTVADQLAIALQKASLYSDLQTSLQQEKAMRSQLVQSERLALVGRLLASVSHELNNPLQAIQNALFLLKEARGISEQGQQDLQIVLSETERMAAMIERLRTSYRPTREGDFQPVQLNTVVEDIYALVATHLRHNQIVFDFHPNPDLPPVTGLPDQLRQVVLNLLMNAVQAMPTGGRLTVITDCTSANEVMVSVKDTGPGIDPHILPHIFDAFVTDKESGTGLGLTITYDIIHRHNGRIMAENDPEGGATFYFWIPARERELQ